MGERSAAIQKRIDMDLLRRSSVGLAVYLTIFPIIFYPSGFYSSLPWLSWGITAVVGFVCLLRIIHRLLTPKLYDRAPKLWMLCFAGFALAHASILGAFFALTLVKPELSPVLYVTIFVIAGTSSGAISSLSPSLILSYLYAPVLLLPGVVTVIVCNGDVSQAIVMTLYLGYLMAVSRVANKEYLRTFSIEAQLEIQKQELETLSRTDALTGIYNRGYFNELLQLHWNTGRREGIPLTLLLIDIDHFKGVNDQYGHSSGDKCIIKVAQLLTECLNRKTDISCRYGGEEFAVFLGSTSIEEAEKIAEAIRSKIENSLIEYSGNAFSVTVSVGLTQVFALNEMPLSELIDRADQALYQAKNAGRNCVRVFAPSV